VKKKENITFVMGHGSYLCPGFIIFNYSPVSVKIQLAFELRKNENEIWRDYLPFLL
jgi:hypothetical protein